MNYEYADAYLEIMASYHLNNDPSLRRIKKSIIKTIAQYTREGGKPYVAIWVDGETYYFNGSMEEFDKAYKTVYI